MRVGVGAIVVDRACRVLVGRRLGSHGAGRLALPGGHLEVGEGWSECASREVLEETGLRIAPTSFEHVGTTNDVMAAEGKHYVTLFMLARLPEGAVAQNLEPHKNAGWEWRTWAELQAAPADELFIPMRNLLRSGYAPQGAAVQQQQQRASREGGDAEVSTSP